MNLSNKVLISGSFVVVTALVTLEGMHTHPYLDIGGVPTACTGITQNVDMNKIYTVPECQKLLTQQIQLKQPALLKCINVPIKQNEYDAYTIMAFNIGTGAFCGSSTVKQLNLGNHLAACKLIATGPTGKPNWSYVNGKYVQGLYNRRVFERDMCLKDLK